MPTSLIVATGHPCWGEFGGHRDESPDRIIAGLLSSDLDEFTRELFRAPVCLSRTPAWAGPLYRVGGDGNHRVHTARMLNLPWLAAHVEGTAEAPSWEIASLISEDPDRDEERRRPLEQRLRERADLAQGLIRRGIIDGELTDGAQVTLHCRRLPASWLLRAPEYATKINAVYESRYPGALALLGIPVAVGTDPAAWTRWLRSP